MAPNRPNQDGRVNGVADSNRGSRPPASSHSNQHRITRTARPTTMAQRQNRLTNAVVNGNVNGGHAAETGQNGVDGDDGEEAALETSSSSEDESAEVGSSYSRRNRRTNGNKGRGNTRGRRRGGRENPRDRLRGRPRGRPRGSGATAAPNREASAGESDARANSSLPSYPDSDQYPNSPPDLMDHRLDRRQERSRNPSPGSSLAARANQVQDNHVQDNVQNEDDVGDRAAPRAEDGLGFPIFEEEDILHISQENDLYFPNNRFNNLPYNRRNRLIFKLTIHKDYVPQSARLGYNLTVSVQENIQGEDAGDAQNVAFIQAWQICKPTAEFDVVSPINLGQTLLNPGDDRDQGLYRTAFCMKALFNSNGSNLMGRGRRADLTDHRLMFIEDIFIRAEYQRQGMLHRMLPRFHRMIQFSLPVWFAFKGNLVMNPAKPPGERGTTRDWAFMSEFDTEQRLILIFSGAGFGYEQWVRTVQLPDTDTTVNCSVLVRII